MPKPISVALILSAGTHIAIGVSLAALSVDRLPLSAEPPARRFTVDLFREPAPAAVKPENVRAENVKPEDAKPEDAKKVVSTTASSEVKQPNPGLPPEPLKTAEKFVRREPAPQHDSKVEIKQVKKPVVRPAPRAVEEIPHVADRQKENGGDIEASTPQAKFAGIDSEYRLIKEPSLASNPVPLRYPHRARRTGQEGVVILEVKLDSRGVIVTMDIEKSSGHKILDRAALSAVGRWQFLPLIENGQAMRSRVRIPVRFKLS